VCCDSKIWLYGLSLALAGCNAGDDVDSPGFTTTTFTGGATSFDTGEASTAASEATSDASGATGDGDGTVTAGDGDGATGDGDGATGDGDGDGTTGDGDGTAGDGDGTAGDGDGDGTTGDGDGTTGDGDGDGDGTTGDGDYFQGFEMGAPGSEYSTGGSGNWTIVSNSAMTGTSSGASPASTSTSSNYWAQLTLTFDVPGSFQFAYRVSTESGFDDLTFAIDGSSQTVWDGEVPWTLSSAYPVAAGSHTFRFTYSKDGSVDGGQDRVWIDDITAVNGHI
jgi:hypothetical protein